MAEYVKLRLRAKAIEIEFEGSREDVDKLLSKWWPTLLKIECQNSPAGFTSTTTKTLDCGLPPFLVPPAMRAWSLNWIRNRAPDPQISSNPPNPPSVAALKSVAAQIESANKMTPSVVPKPFIEHKSPVSVIKPVADGESFVTDPQSAANSANSRDCVVMFPRGILGFPKFHSFILTALEPNSALYWLKSNESPRLLFFVTDLSRSFPNYNLTLTRDIQQELDLNGLADAHVFVILSRHGATFTANLQGPLVVNSKTNIGAQMLNSDKKAFTRILVYSPESMPFLEGTMVPDPQFVLRLKHLNSGASSGT